MDIISGLVVITSAFIFGAALAGGLATRALSHNPGASSHSWGATKAVLGTIVVVYFVSTTHLLLIAQQSGLAAGNLVIGLVLLFVQFVEPAVRAGRRPLSQSDEAENWRR